MRQKIKFIGVFFAVAVLCAGLLSASALPQKGTAAPAAETATAKKEAVNSTAVTEAETRAAMDAASDDIYFEKEVYGIELYKSYKITLSVSPENTYPGALTWGVGNPDVAKIDANGVVTMKKLGQSAVFATTPEGLAAVCTVTANLPAQWFIEDVPVLCQWDDFPSGCESISATMLLQYYGYAISPYDFVDKYVPTSYLTEDGAGNLFGPDTSSVFIGSPYSTESLGCFPPVIAHAANQVLENGNEAVVTTGSSMDSMIQNYILQDKPVLIWSTMYMWEPFITYEWTVTDAAEYSTYEDGDTCTWIANEHCLVLTGYDENYYYFNDPNFTYSIRYEKDIFKERFAQIGYASMAIKGEIQKNAATN